MDSLLVLATSNLNKLKEINELLKDFPVTVQSLADFGPTPEAVEDGATFDDNVIGSRCQRHSILKSGSPGPALAPALDAGFSPSPVLPATCAF